MRDGEGGCAYRRGMDSGKTGKGNKIMTNAEGQTSLAAQIMNISMVIVGAGFLGYIGLLLRTTDRVFGHLSLSDLWLMPLIAGGLWNMLSLEFNSRALQVAIHWWPLLPLLAGGAVLLTMKSNRRGAAAPTSRTGGDHGR